MKSVAVPDTADASTSLSTARPPDHDHLAWLATYAGIAFPGKALLDLGTGSGFLCDAAARQGARHVVGVDVVRPAGLTSGWTFQNVDLEGSDWPAAIAKPGDGKKFDLVTAFDIVEHLSSPVKFLEDCRSLLEPGGKLVLTTPNTNSWERVARGERWSGATDPQHKVLFSRYSLRFLLERCGFNVETLRSPLRRLAFLGPLCPEVGAQIFCVATVANA